MAYPTDYFPCPDLRVFTSRKKARKFAVRETGHEPNFGPESDAVTNTYMDGDNKWVCLIVVPKAKDMGREKRIAILAHECVHAVQEWAEAMGEENPGDEWEAYAVQACMLAALDQLGRKWL